MSYLINLLASPLPGWFPKMAIVAFIVLFVAAFLLLGGMVTFMFSAGRKLVRGKELPQTLTRLRDAGHPVRKHQHYHYSAKASEAVAPLTEAEYEAFGVDEDFHH